MIRQLNNKDTESDDGNDSMNEDFSPYENYGNAAMFLSNKMASMQSVVKQ